MMPWVSEAILPEVKGGHIALTCEHHPDLFWSTKNLGWVGARSIFFLGWLPEDPYGREGVSTHKHPATGEFARECDCPFEALMIVDTVAWRLERRHLGPPLPEAMREAWRKEDWEAR